MAKEPIVLMESAREIDPARTVRADRDHAWKYIAWFSLLLAMAGVGDWVLAWIPLRLGTPEWEFGTVAASFAGLPLVTMGFAGLLGSAIARGIRWQIITVASVVLLFALLIAGAFVVFLLDVPIALAAVPGGVARLGIMKAIAKTTLLGVLFGGGYAVAGVAALRFALARRHS